MRRMRDVLIFPFLFSIHIHDWPTCLYSFISLVIGQSKNMKRKDHEVMTRPNNKEIRTQGLVIDHFVEKGMHSGDAGTADQRPTQAFKGKEKHVGRRKPASRNQNAKKIIKKIIKD
jgi:hypothetical protein